MRLGTWGSYGIEKLKILPGEGWESLTITATFVTPTTSTRMLVSEDGLVTVPPEATASVFTAGFPARIVFSGVADGVQRITTDLPYRVSDHAPIEGDASTPTPSEWEQFVSQVQGAASDAKESATEAADSASAAAGSATQAAQSAEKADKSAQSAEEALEQVQATGNSALQSIGAAKSDALSSIGTAKTTAVNAVQQAQQSAVQAVELTGTEQVNAVRQAGDDKLAEIADINALLPAPTEEDAGKAPIAQPDGTYALKEVTVDAYTEAESDARYAPIEAAIKVSGKGTGLVGLSPTVGWYQQDLRILGRAWQDGTPSVEQEVPIQKAGQSGQIEVSVCRVNLLDIPSLDLNEKTVNGVTCQLNEDQTINLSGTATNNYLLTVNTSIPLVNGKQYKCFYASESLKNDYIVRGYSTKKDADNSQNHVGQKYLNDIQIFTVPNDGKYYRIFQIRLSARSGELKGQAVNVNNACLGFYVYKGLDEIYKPYQSQQLPIHTPDALPGIPVDSGGNWVDESGQQWVSDVIDLAAQERTNRVLKTNTASNDALTWINSFYSAGNTTVRFGYNTELEIVAALSNKLSLKQIWSLEEVGFYFTQQGAIICRIPKALVGDTMDSAKEYLKKNPIEFLIASANVLSTLPLDADTFAAYRALQTYPGTTNIIAPDCGIEASAVGDATQIIANITDKIAALESSATGI